MYLMRYVNCRNSKHFAIFIELGQEEYSFIYTFSTIKHFSDHIEDLPNENKSSKLINLCKIMCLTLLGDFDSN